MDEPHPRSGARWRRALLGIGLALAVHAPAAPSRAAAADGIVLGDSIGVGVSMASGLPRLARISVAIRGPAAIEQLRGAPRGSTVFLSLGTNDAVGPLPDLRPEIARILTVAAGERLRLVWIGPPCVRKSWNRNVRALDAVLRTALADRAIYVGASEARFCDRTIKARDGVHFTMRGYGMLWGKGAPRRLARWRADLRRHHSRLHERGRGRRASGGARWALSRTTRPGTCPGGG